MEREKESFERFRYRICEQSLWVQQLISKYCQCEGVTCKKCNFKNEHGECYKYILTEINKNV